jgi:hypothetical protein
MSCPTNNKLSNMVMIMSPTLAAIRELQLPCLLKVINTGCNLDTTYLIMPCSPATNMDVHW